MRWRWRTSGLILKITSLIFFNCVWLILSCCTLCRFLFWSRRFIWWIFRWGVSNGIDQVFILFILQMCAIPVQLNRLTLANKTFYKEVIYLLLFDNYKKRYECFFKFQVKYFTMLIYNRPVKLMVSTIFTLNYHFIQNVWWLKIVFNTFVNSHCF